MSSVKYRNTIIDCMCFVNDRSRGNHGFVYPFALKMKTRRARKRSDLPRVIRPWGAGGSATITNVLPSSPVPLVMKHARSRFLTTFTHPQFLASPSLHLLPRWHQNFGVDRSEALIWCTSPPLHSFSRTGGYHGSATGTWPLAPAWGRPLIFLYWLKQMNVTNWEDSKPHLLS